MTEQEKAFHAEAEEKQRQILAEGAQGGAAAANSGDQVVEVRVGADGILIRAGAPSAVKALDTTAPASAGTVGPEELPCASSCADAIDDASTAFLHALPFSEEQEQVLQDVIAMYDVSRDKALVRLWQRAVMRQITDEASRLIEQAKSDG